MAFNSSFLKHERNKAWQEDGLGKSALQTNVTRTEPKPVKPTGPTGSQPPLVQTAPPNRL
jgi:hypothetical protein